MRGLNATTPPEYAIDHDVECPKCGCNACEIISYPHKGGWRGVAGRARCDCCRIQFSIKYEEIEN